MPEIYNRMVFVNGKQPGVKKLTDHARTFCPPSEFGSCATEKKKYSFDLGVLEKNLSWVSTVVG